jgi:hypothetical protein
MEIATEDGHALEERLTRVERRARWLSAMTTVLALLCVALIVWQFGLHDPVVQARGFVLRDTHWRARAELKIREDGSPILRLNNLDGRSRATLQLRDDGMVALRMMDADGVLRAELRLEKGGEPSLLLSGTNGQPRVVLATDEQGDSGTQRVVLRDRSGRPVWSAPVPAGAGDQAARSR